MYLLCFAEHYRLTRNASSICCIVCVLLCRWLFGFEDYHTKMNFQNKIGFEH